MGPLKQNRRTFLSSASGLLGLTALGSLEDGLWAGAQQHFPAKVKHVIYLFMSGGPSHVDTFDNKPELTKRHNQPIPESFVDGVHFAMIPPTTKRPKLYGSPYAFRQHGDSGAWISSAFPQLARVADRLTFIKSLHSKVFNHDPAVNLVNTGDSRVGRPTLGAWISYGLGNLTEDFPAYIVLTSGVKRQPLLTSYWTSGFLPTEHQGVELRNSGDPILFLSSPAGLQREQRKQQLDLIRQMNERKFRKTLNPEITARMKQYELAFQMQLKAPQLMDLSKESRQTLAEYGVSAEPSFARNCLLARRMVESGVRFVQLYDMGWDSHDQLKANHDRQCRSIDQAITALIEDLARRGLLDETLVIWGGEFGRTPVVQGSGDKWGRDHHPHGFTMWMAGGGIKPGITRGATDQFGFHAVEEKTDIHDLHATILHTLGVDHKRLTYRHQGRNFRLTDVGGRVLHDLLS